jgi:outer membrane receptor protein involved in Fe transport
LGVKGVELFYQEPFLFLPAPLDGLGAMASLTWATGNAAGPGTAFTANNLVTLYKMPINGLAKWSYSVTLYYEKGPFSVRGTYNWNSKTTTNGVGSQGAELQQWQQARGQMDGSIAYDVTDDIEFRLEGSNLLNEVAYQFFTDPATNSKIGSRYAATGIGSGGNENVTWQGRTFVFSIRGKL